MPSAQCLVCGELVLLVMAALHVEDHQQRGELPPTLQVG